MTHKPFQVFWSHMIGLTEEKPKDSMPLGTADVKPGAMLLHATRLNMAMFLCKWDMVKGSFFWENNYLYFNVFPHTKFVWLQNTWAWGAWSLSSFFFTSVKYFLFHSTDAAMSLLTKTKMI